ncbi:copper resistance protein B [Phenylobacterium sp.]|uniref:copper resistance protein B n=1 Tax=Phenylobacterium sp. TaxID=1871053 RepID=UPI0025F1AAFD|nr:copper resistance protein B [Phenylobacterium sp.]
MTRLALMTAAAVIAASPTLAQPADPHAGHAMPAPQADPHAGHAESASASAARTGADLPVGDAPAPRPPSRPLADAIFGTAAMEPARELILREHGGAAGSQVMLDIAEFDTGSKAYEWEGEAWFGTDEHRVVLKSEGEGARGEAVEHAEIQALYGRPVTLYGDLQVGIRQDLQAGPDRTYATIGFESLFPYWFEAEGALFLSQKGELSARVEGSYDFRLTQRLVIQPRAELNAYAEDVPSLGVGSGLADAELALRLRYEIRREFAPYVGVVWTRRFGDTARFARAAGDGAEETRLVAGLRAWF